jgi:hypothetical protein
MDNVTEQLLKEYTHLENVFGLKLMRIIDFESYKEEREENTFYEIANNLMELNNQLG